MEPRCLLLPLVAALQGAPSTGGLACELRLDADDPLVAHAWEGALPVPATFVADPVRIDFGAAGLAARTRLYLPFDEGAGRVTRDVAEGGVEVPLGDGVDWRRGRFGHALVLESASGGVTVEARVGLFAPPWTLELWVAPDVLEPATLLAADGAFALRMEAGGTCVFTLEPGGEQAPFELRSEEALRAGAWNHVAVVYDDVPDLRHVRLVVNGSVAGRVRTSEQDIARAGAAAALHVGGFAGAVDDLRVIGRAAMSAELIERFEAESPMEARLTLRYRDRVETVSLWRDVLARSVIAGEALGRVGRLRQVVADAEGLRWVPAHWEREHASAPPMARTTHPTIPVGDGRVFVFGGETRDSHFHDWHNTNDTWLYDTRARSWERVETDVAPPPTCHQGAAYSPDHDYVLYFGGARNDQGPEPVSFGDTWAFHVGERRWEQLDTVGDAPPGAGCGVVYVPPLGSFVAVRGRRASVFVPESRTWLHLPPARVVDEAGEPVDADFGGSMMAAYDPASRRILLFGGEVYDADGGTFFDHTGWLHVPSNTITIVSAEPRPAARVRSGFAHDPVREQFVLFGGVRGQFSERFGDLWAFRAGRWERLESSNTPSARGGYYGMAYEPAADAFFLLCGRHSPTRFLNEAWRLVVRPGEPGVAEYVLDASARTAGARWFVDADVPAGASVDARFRASDDGRRWGAWSSRPDENAAFVGVRLELRPGPGGASPVVRSFGFR